jgi:hypothetical protein
MSVIIKDDSSCEMLQVVVNGKVIESGNYWDYNSKSILINVLQALKVDVTVDNSWDWAEDGE